MSSISELILASLDELHEDELKRFKLFLTNTMAQGFDPIPRSRLENAKQDDVTQLMVDKYGESKAAKITVQVLKQIPKNKLASELEKKLEGQASGGQVQAVDGVGVSSSSSQAGGVSQNISADKTSNINAPVLSGGHFNGPVTINFTSTPN